MQTSSINLATGALGDCGCGCSGAGACARPAKPPGFTMDTPHRRGSASETPFTRMLGHVLNVRGLAGLQPTDTSGQVMTRANNLSSLAAAMLLKIKPEKREMALTEIAGMSYTQHVLDFAKNYPGALGVTDAIRFSLALHFLIGIMDAEAGRQSFYADGYLAFAKLFKTVQARRNGEPPPREPGEIRGLGGLGQATAYPAPPDQPVNQKLFQVANCGPLGFDGSRDDKQKGVVEKFTRVFGRGPNGAEVNYYGSMRWCSSPGTPDKAMVDTMTKVRDAISAGKVFNTTPNPVEGGPVTPYDTSIRTAGADMSAGIQQAADAAFDFIGKAGDFIVDVLCKGFKALFGPQIGGVICDIITFLTKSLTAAAAAIVEIATAAIKAVMEFIKEMIAGHVEAAFLALLKGVGQMIFALSAPIAVPMMYGKNAPLKDSMADLRVKADRVTKRNPLWPITFIMAIVGLFPVPSPQAIVSLIIALSPMLAVFIAPLLKQLPVLAREALDTVEVGIEKFVKFALIIFQGVMSISSLLPTLKAQLKSFFDQKPGAAGPGMKATDRIKDIVSRFENGIKVITNVFSKFNFKDISAAAVPLLSAIPELVVAIIPDAKTEIPSLTSWIDSAKQAGKSVDDAEKNLQAGAQELLKSISPEAAGAVMRAQLQAQGQSPGARTQMVKTVAAVLGTQFKDKTSYPQFAAELRAELLKV